MKRKLSFLRIIASLFMFLIVTPVVADLNDPYYCVDDVEYTSCEEGYYLSGNDLDTNWSPPASSTLNTDSDSTGTGNICRKCSEYDSFMSVSTGTYTCPGGTSTGPSYAIPCRACATVNASCTLSTFFDNTDIDGIDYECAYTTACNTGYENIQNNGAYNASCTPKAYNVILEDNIGSGGQGNVTVTYNVYMDDVSIPNLIGYTFTGYYDDDDTGDQYFDSDGIAQKAWDKDIDNYTLYAAWEANQYIVSFSANGGTGGQTANLVATYNSGMPALTQGISTRVGYTFTGYWDAASGGTQYYTNTGASARAFNKTTATLLYAQWTANTYAVSFNSNGGTGGQTTNLTATYNFAMPALTQGIPNRIGYSFAGYWDAASGGIQYYTSGSLSARNWDKTTAATLYAHWNLVTYTVYLVDSPGSGGQGSVDVNYGYYPDDVTVPTRTGYTFDGYYDDDDTGNQYYDSDGIATFAWDKAADDITIYAHWNANTYTVTLDMQGGTGGTASVFATYDSAMPSIAVPTRTGYTFIGYYTNTNGSGTRYYNESGISAKNWEGTSNTTLYAYWLPLTYTVTFNANGGTGGQTTNLTATYDAAMPALTQGVATRTGYTFNGYYDATTGGTQYYTAAGASARTFNKTSATTLYAQWTANTYTVTLDMQSGTGGTTSVVATFNSTMPTPITVPTRTGYTFGGYYTAIGGLGINYYTNAGIATSTLWAISSDTTLYAKWTANTYTVTFDKQSGTGGTDSTTATYNSAMPSIAVPTRTGYTFNGYFDGTNGTGTQYYTGGGASSSFWNKTTAATLYASWTANTYRLTFDFENATTNGTPGYVDVQYGQTRNALTGYSAPTKVGFGFMGYTDGDNGTGTIFYTPTGTASTALWNTASNGTLHASWIAVGYLCTPGKYLPAGATSCSECMEGYYCPGGTYTFNTTLNQGLTVCPINYDDGGTGLSSIYECQFNTSPGYYILNSEDTDETICPAGYACPSTYINWEDTGTITQCTGATWSDFGVSVCQTCPSIYTYDTTAGKTSSSQCKTQTTSGQYIALGGDSSQSTCPANSTCPSTIINYGSTGVANACTVCSPTNATCSLSVVSNTCTYTTACITGYGSIVNNGAYNPSCSANTYPIAFNNTSATGGTAPTSFNVTYNTTLSTLTNVTLVRTGYTLVGFYDTSYSNTQYYTCTGTTGAKTCNSSATWTRTTGTTLTPMWNINSYTCDAGDYLTAGATSCSECTNGNYCPGGTYTFNTTSAQGINVCPDNYDDGGTGLSEETQCQFLTTDGYYILNNEDTDETICPAGYYCPSAYIDYGSVGDIGTCLGATYSAAGASICSTCPTIYTADTTNAKTSISQCKTQTTAGNYIATINAGSQSTCPANSTCPASLVSYGSTGVVNACSVCSPTNATCSLSVVSNTCTYSTACNIGYGNIVNNGAYNPSCTPNQYAVTLNNQSATTAGTLSVNATFNSTLPTPITVPAKTGYSFSGYYSGLNGSGTQYYNATGVATAATWTTAAAGELYANWGVVTYTCSAGTYLPAGNTTCNQCSPANYCPGGSWPFSAVFAQGITSCPAAYSADTTSYGNSSINQCKMQTTAGTYVATANATSTTTCLAGSSCPAALINYGSTGSITQCTGATYSAAGASVCSTCPSIYTYDTTAGKTSIIQCKTQTTAGQYIATGGASSQTSCPALSSCPSALISYGLTGIVNACTACSPTNATCSLSVVSNTCTYSTACNIGYGNIVNNGAYNPSCTPNQYTLDIDSMGGDVSGSYTVTFNEYPDDIPAAVKTGYTFTGYFDDDNMGEKYFDETGAALLIWNKINDATFYAHWDINSYICPAGQYLAAGATSCSTCTNGNYCPGGTYTFNTTSAQGLTGCPTNYDDGGTGLSLQSQCAMQTVGGTYVEHVNNTSATTCTAGYYCPASLVPYGSSNFPLICVAGTYSGTGAASCTSCASVGTGTYTNSAAGSTSSAACYTTCTGGNYVATSGAACSVLTTNNKYIQQNYVYYGQTSVAETCDIANGYNIISKLLSTDHDSINDCYQTCSIENITPTGATKEPKLTIENYPNYCVYIANCPYGYSAVPSGNSYDTSGYTTDPYCDDISYTITFNSNGGVLNGGGTSYTKTCLFGYSCVFNDTQLSPIARTGYLFTGWAKSLISNALYWYGDDINGLETASFDLYALWGKCFGGYVWNGTECSICPIGSYNPSGDLASGAAKSCSGCGPGKTTDTTGSTSSAACKDCPTGFFCGVNGGTAFSCSAVGDGSWPLSAIGSLTQSDCYKNCPNYALTNGTAVAKNSSEFYPENCEYTCVSNTGNPGVIDGNICKETSCAPNYKMVNGICTLCDIEHALTYKTTGNCVVASCEAGWHAKGQSCEPDVLDCVIPNAEVAKKTWNYSLNAYSICIAKTCDTGYHISSNACVIDEQVCKIENGTGTKVWNTTTNTWGNCVVDSCNPGYTSDASQTNETSKPCGVCKNKYTSNGDLIVSSYTTECEISSCMYQGELYNLEGNECVQICNTSEDDTGTMQWNSTTKKCSRTCKTGYSSW